jgi:predicted  nucleic acid-binding Zn-ribbon protein|nr:MAG TPA: Neck appendage protein [Caudoviricetes sp.]
MNNVRIAIRDSTDSYNIDFFDNVSGIHYHTADLKRFLAGSSSILTLKYRTKDIDKVTAGCKLAFRYKNKDFWLNIMEVKKNGFDKELTAFSLILEANNEDEGPFSADKGMTMVEYIKKFDAESSLTIGVNEVADKSIKLEWTGTDTMLARLFSVANSFDAELEFVTELNDDYSLKRHVLNIYRTGNFGKNATGLPVRVGKELKVINYSESIKNLRTVVFATGKDGLTIEGLSKKVYDDNGELLYETSGAFIRAVQSRDRFPSVGKNTTDNYALLNLGDTEYETKEALYGYMLSELKKRCLPEMDFEVEGVIDGDVGDTKTLIDDVFHEPELYVQARISELTESIITGENTNVVLSNYERKYSQIADSLLKQVEALAEDAAPYIVRLSTDNGYNFKNGQGTSTITAKLEKYSKIVNSNWKWLINNSIVSETSSVTINASQVIGTLNVVAVAIVDGNEVAREYITFTNSDDGVGIKSIKRYYTTNDQAEGVTAGGQNWSTKPTTVTADNKYMWSYDVVTYTNDTSLVTEPAVIGARGDDGLDADTTGITEALDKAKQELSALSANIEKVRDDSLAAVAEAKQQLTTVANDLNTAKQDLQTQASQLTAQASAQSELTKRVSSVEETANGTKTTVSELSKTVDSNTKNITSVTARTKTVEDDLTSTKTTLSQVKTTADNTSKKTATLETGLNGVKADLTATTTTANTTKTNLANYQASNDKAVANLQSSLKTTNGNVSSLQTKIEAVPGQITSAVSAVEGKIPTEIGSSNLLRKTAVNTDNLRYFTAWNVSVSVDGQAFKIVSTEAKSGGSGFIGNNKIYNLTKDRFYTFGFWVLANKDKTYNYNNLGHFQAVGEDNTTNNLTTPVYNLTTIKAGVWTRVYCTFKATATAYFRPYFLGLKSGDEIHIRDLMLNEGKVPLTYTPAVEDDITKLNTTLTQTANGLKQLSTQVTSQGSTITSHTNSINSLTTGLSAKVSQTDFNTLSGRVTTAENNITAKANELSSKITSVEGKIPTAIGGRNLLTKTNQGATGWNWIMQAGDKTIESVSSEGINAVKLTKGTATAHSGYSVIYCSGVLSKLIESDTQYVLSFDVYPNVYTTFNATLMDSNSSNRLTTVATMNTAAANKWTKVSCILTRLQNLPANIGGQVVYLTGMSSANGVSYIIKNIKLEKGNIPTDWTPAPEDYDSKLATAQSEIKQTTDAISASVSALDNATVKTASLNLDNNGFVTKVGKTVNGNTFATMIAQDENDVQIIAKKMKVSGDMIVNGAITAEKLNVNSLSALSAKLGDVTSGSITNAFSSGTRSGNIKIKDNVEITSTDTSNLLPEKAKENLVLSTGSLAMNASTSSDEATHSMLIMPETIKYTKNNYDTTRGGTSGWSLTHNGYYSMLQVDMVWQNVRLNNTSNLMYGIVANYVRIGNLVTISINRQISNIAVVAENEIASEKIPEGFRPISQAHLVLVGGTNKSIDATCIVHLNPDGSIGFTNNKTGNHVWSGTVTYTCVEPMPYVKDLNNGSTI